MNPTQESDQSFSHARMLTSNRTTMPIMFAVENESSWYINDDREFRRVCERKNEAEFTEERQTLVGVIQDGSHDEKMKVNYVKRNDVLLLPRSKYAFVNENLDTGIISLMNEKELCNQSIETDHA